MYPDTMKLMCAGDHSSLFAGKECRRREFNATNWAILGSVSRFTFPNIAKHIYFRKDTLIEYADAPSSTVLYSDFSSVTFNKLFAQDATFYNCSFRKSPLIKGDIMSSSFEGVDFTVTHMFCGLVDTNFLDCNFSRAKFDAEAVGCSFWNCDFYKADLSGLKLVDSCFNKSKSLLALPVSHNEFVYAVNHGDCIKVKYGTNWLPNLKEFAQLAEEFSDSRKPIIEHAVSYIEWFANANW